jgi:hypothetical protein
MRLMILFAVFIVGSFPNLVFGDMWARTYSDRGYEDA